MLIWRHDHFARQHHIYLFSVDVILAAWLFCPPTSHLLVLSPSNITSTCFTRRVSRCNFSGKRYCNCLLVQNEMYWVPASFFFWIPNFGIGILTKKNSDRNLWNWKWYWSSTSDGGPRNWNQKSEFQTSTSIKCFSTFQWCLWAYECTLTLLHQQG